MTQASEVPFLSGMEREPVCETTLEVGKKAFQIDGVLDRLLKKAREALEARTREDAPKDYVDDDDDIHRLAGIIERLAQRPPMNFNNGGGDDTDSLKKWIAGLGVVLSASFIIGGWVLSTQVATLTAKVDEIKDHQKTTDERLTRIEQNERRP